MIFSPRNPLQISKAIVRPISVKVVGLFTILRGAVKRRENNPMHNEFLLRSVVTRPSENYAEISIGRQLLL
jgi:hypothetical protein